MDAHYTQVAMDAHYTKVAAGGNATSWLPSTQTRQCTCAVLAVLAASVSAVAVVAGTSSGIFDPGSSLSAAYVLVLFSLQTWMLEWPHLDSGIFIVLASAFAVFLIPTVAHCYGLWNLWFMRIASLAIDVVLVAATQRYMVRSSPCHLRPNSLRGRVCIITGSNTGIGFKTAEALARAGAQVVFACRSEEKARAAMAQLVQGAGSAGVTEEQLHFIQLDVSSLGSVRRFVEAFQAKGLPLHLLILNAGVMLHSRELSEDGFERTLASNHFGHFLLSRLLLPLLLEAEARGDEPRIVVVSSAISYQPDSFDFTETIKVVNEDDKQAFLTRPYTMFSAYAQSKLANVLFTSEFARILEKKGSKIPVNAVHPGEVLTEVMRDFPSVITLLLGFCMRHCKPVLLLFIKTPEEGSSCILHLATAAELGTSEAASGKLFMRHRPEPLGKAARDVAAAQRLWAVSDTLTGATSPI